MKKAILLVLLALLTLPAMSQEKKYKETMGSTIEKMHKASDAAGEMELVPDFEDLAQSYPDQWLPSYHASRILVTSSFEESDAVKSDALCLNCLREFSGDVHTPVEIFRHTAIIHCQCDYAGFIFLYERQDIVNSLFLPRYGIYYSAFSVTEFQSLFKGFGISRIKDKGKFHRFGYYLRQPLHVLNFLGGVAAGIYVYVGCSRFNLFESFLRNKLRVSIPHFLFDSLARHIDTLCDYCEHNLVPPLCFSPGH